MKLGGFLHNSVLHMTNLGRQVNPSSPEILGISQPFQGKYGVYGEFHNRYPFNEGFS